MNPKSSLFKEIEANLIENIFKEKLGAENINSILLLDGGMFNTTYKVIYDNKIVVLRLGPVNRHLLMGFEKHLMQAETFVYNLCEAHEIICPKVLVFDSSRELLDRDYMITEYISGRVMSKVNLKQEEKQMLQKRIGEYIAKLHCITNNRFGFVSRLVSDDLHMNMSWAECLIRETDDILEHLIKIKGLKIEECYLIKKVFQENKKLLDEIKTPHLLHTDLWEGNVLLSLQDEELSIKAVIDGDRAVFGDEDFEWAAPWMDMPAIYEGAGIEKNIFEHPDRVKRREIYRIVYYIIECYVGIGEYNNLEQYKSGKKEALRLAEKILKNK